jgi:hypothetical protein
LATLPPDPGTTIWKVPVLNWLLLPRRLDLPPSPSAANAEPTINVAATVKARTAVSEVRRRLLVMANLLFGSAPHFEELIEEEFRGGRLNPA